MPSGDGVALLLADVQSAIDSAHSLFPLKARGKAYARAAGLRSAMQVQQQRVRDAIAEANFGISLLGRRPSMSGNTPPPVSPGQPPRRSSMSAFQGPGSPPAKDVGLVSAVEPLGGYRRAAAHRKSLSQDCLLVRKPSLTKASAKTVTGSAPCPPLLPGTPQPEFDPVVRLVNELRNEWGPSGPSDSLRTDRSSPGMRGHGPRMKLAGGPGSGSPVGRLPRAAHATPPQRQPSPLMEGGSPGSPAAAGWPPSRKTSSPELGRRKSSASSRAAIPQVTVVPVAEDWGRDKLLERIMCAIPVASAQPGAHCFGGVLYAAAAAIVGGHPAAASFPRDIFLLAPPDSSPSVCHLLPRSNVVNVDSLDRLREALEALRQREESGIVCFDWAKVLAEFQSGQWRLSGGAETAQSLRGLSARGWWLVDVSAANDNQQRQHVLALRNAHGLTFSLAAHSQRVSDVALDLSAEMLRKHDPQNAAWEQQAMRCIKAQIGDPQCPHTADDAPEPPLSSHNDPLHVLCSNAGRYHLVYPTQYARRFSGDAYAPVKETRQPTDPRVPPVEHIVHWLAACPDRVTCALPTPCLGAVLCSSRSWNPEQEISEAVRVTEIDDGSEGSQGGTEPVCTPLMVGHEVRTPRAGNSPATTPCSATGPDVGLEQNTPLSSCAAAAGLPVSPTHREKMPVLQEAADAQAAPPRPAVDKLASSGGRSLRSRSPRDAPRGQEAFAWGDFTVEFDEEPLQKGRSVAAAGAEDFLLGDLTNEEQFQFGDFAITRPPAPARSVASPEALPSWLDGEDQELDAMDGGSAQSDQMGSFAFSDFAVSTENDLDVDIACGYYRERGVETSAETFMFGDFCVGVSGLPGTPPPTRKLSAEAVTRVRPLQLEGPAAAHSPGWDPSLIRWYSAQAVSALPSRVKCIIVNRNEEHYATCANSDTSLTMCFLHSGVETQCYIGHHDVLTQAAFSRDSKLLATCSRDKTLRVWDCATARQMSQFDHPKVVICACFSANGLYIVSGCQDWQCRLYKVKNKEKNPPPILCFREHGGIITNIDFEPQGDGVLSASADTSIKVWSASNGQRRCDIEGHRGVVLSARFSRNGKRVLTNDTQQLCISDAASGVSIWRVTVDEFQPRRIDPGKRLSFSLSCWGPGVFGDRYIVAATNDCVVRLLDTKSNDRNDDLELDTRAPVYALNPGPTKTLAYGDFFGNIYTAEFR